MATVGFLGWLFQVEQPASGTVALKRPSTIGTLDFWDVSLRWSDKTLSGNISVVLDGLRVEANFQLPLNTTGSTWVPDDVVFNWLRLSRRGQSNAAGTPGSRILLGPIEPAGFDVKGWDPANGAILFVPRGTIFEAGRPALELRFGATQTWTLDLGHRTVSTGAGAIAGYLHQWLATPPSQSSGVPHSAAFDSTALRFDFAGIADGSQAEIVFNPRVANQEIWLYGSGTDAAHGEPGLIVTRAALAATIKVGPLPSARPMLDALALRPGGGSPRLRLETCGIVNSWGDAEAWTTDRPIPLGLGFADTGATWNGAVILPGISLPLRRETPVRGNLRIHGGVGGHYFEIGPTAVATLCCSRTSADGNVTPAPVWLNKDMALRTTRPWIEFSDASYAFPRYGEAFGGDDHNLAFKGSGAAGGLPATPPYHWAAGANAGAFRRELDGSMQKLAIHRGASTHETGMVDETVQDGAKPIKSLFVSGQDPFALRLEGHTETRAIANALIATTPNRQSAKPLSLPVPLDPGHQLDYAVLWPGAGWNGVALPQIADNTLRESLYGKLIDQAVPIGIGDFRNVDSGRVVPWAIGKFGRKKDLKGILAEIGDHLQSPDAFKKEADRLLALIEQVDAAVTQSSWIGILVLHIELNLDGMPQLKAMVPTTDAQAPVIDFVAIAPQDGTKASWGGVSGAVQWQRPPATTTYVSADYENLDEARFWTDALDIRWRDGRLSHFRSEASLELRTFLGTGVTRDAAAAKPVTAVKIIGSAKRRPGSPDTHPEYDFSFSADTTANDPRGIKIYPVSDSGVEAKPHIISEVWFKKVEIASAKAADPPAGSNPSVTVGDARIMIDGDVKFQSPDWLMATAPNFLGGKDGKSVSFFNLGIALPSLPGFKIGGLRLSYPDLRFDLNLPHVGLLGDSLKLKFQDFTLDWNSVLDGASWPSLGLGKLFGATQSLSLKVPRILIGARLGFGQLPDIFAHAFSDFSLDLLFGLTLNLDRAALDPGFGIGVRGFGFEGLNFDLLPFLTLRMKSLTLAQDKDRNGAMLTANGLSISVLSYRLPYILSGGFFSSNDAKRSNAFFVSAKYDPNADDTKGLLKFNYGFVGQNLDMSAADANVRNFLEAALLPVDSGKPSTPLTEDTGFEKAWQDQKIRPADVGGEGMGWTFAAEIEALNGLLRGRALIQDRGFKGLALYIDTVSNPEAPGARALKEWFGDSFGFVGLYHKGANADDDYFHMSLTLPEMTLPAFRMVGGVMAVTLWTNGGFQLDFGFPWQEGTTRQWSRTVGLIITPGQASAGFYFKKTTSHDADGTNLTIAAGFAIQWGLGGAWGGGVFKAWARVGVYGVIEGSAVVRYDTEFALLQLEVTGAVGVLLEGRGEIDWWVINIQVGLKATAELRIHMVYIPHQPTLVELAADLYVSASARACIGGGWFKVCKSISVGLSVPVHYNLRL